YDDKVLITFNYKEGTQTITFEEAAQAASKENGSDLDCFTAPNKKDPNRFSKEKGSDLLFLAACPAAQQKHPQRMAGLFQLRRSALRMLIF
ncbi:MAG: hypothetical protein UEY35_02665, partial [Faecalibacterium prausnitzii]|nr:hypothetical protein [Faecalibacterium prausnitzii]